MTLVFRWRQLGREVLLVPCANTTALTPDAGEGTSRRGPSPVRFLCRPVCSAAAALADERANSSNKITTTLSL
jgi:hypothetical protein